MPRIDLPACRPRPCFLGQSARRAPLLREGYRVSVRRPGVRACVRACVRCFLETTDGSNLAASSGSFPQLSCGRTARRHQPVTTSIIEQGSQPNGARIKRGSKSRRTQSPNVAAHYQRRDSPSATYARPQFTLIRNFYPAQRARTACTAAATSSEKTQRLPKVGSAS
ncbi:hypothetical protein BKA80DRAFT_31582 [Phyllosticta citrichinensis]